MRKSDKKQAIKKANVLIEERFLNSKSLITEAIMGKLEYDVLEAYLVAALWTNEEEIEGGNIHDFDPEAKESANNDVLAFMKAAGELLQGMEPEQIGHDLWLTRNGHGAGFWDRGLGEKGEVLSNIARKMGGKDLYRGDDGKLYFS